MAFAACKSSALRWQSYPFLCMPILAWLILLLVSSFAVAGPGADGHTHDDETAPLVSAASPRVTMQGELYDVVAVLKKGELTFYVDRVSDNAPVDQATLEVTAGEATFMPAPASDGTYKHPADALASGVVEFIVSISAADGDDLLAGTLTIPAGHSEHANSPSLGAFLGLSLSHLWAALVGGLFTLAGLGALKRRSRSALGAALVFASLAFAAEGWAAPGGDGHTHGDEGTAVTASDAPHRLPDGSVFVPKPTQRFIELRTMRTAETTVQKTVILPGRVIANPNRSGVVQSINGGRVIAPDGGLPTLGQPVSRGQLLALIEPPINAADETSISDKIGELSQQIAIAEIRLARFAALAATNAVPKTQVTDLEAEVDALRNRLAAVRTQRREPEQLRAPVDGFVAANGVVAGQVVGPQDRLFQIVDPASLWVEALAFGGADTGAIVGAAVMRADNGGVPLKLEGISRILQRQAVQIHFSLAEPGTDLRVGESVRVIAQTKDSVTGIVLPREAIVRATSGETIVWTLVAPERFEPRPVRIVPVDGGRMAVTAGLGAGERVVVRGAELVNQIR